MSRERADIITLNEITRANIHAVLALDVSDDQRAGYPRSNGYSIAEGFFPPDDDPVWMRAICKDDTPIGFIMTSERPSEGAYFIWRMMIDAEHQGAGHGAAALNLLIGRIKATANPRVLLLTHLETNVSAGRFYERVGFTYTGERSSGGDLEMAMRFD